MDFGKTVYNLNGFAGVKVSVYCPVGKSEQGKFGLEVAVKVLDLYKKYVSYIYFVIL